jgi:putative peptidoglycan lipid II flippase
MLRASLRLFTGSLLGKLAGALREILLAYLFGTSGTVAALRAAQSATLIPVNFFSSDSLSAGFLPLYSRYHRADGHHAAALFWWLAGLLMVASTAVFLILVFGAPYWVHILVPGFGRPEHDETLEFVRIMGLGVPFYIAGALFSYLEMAHGSYVLASARAGLQSAGMISGMLAAYALHRPSLMAWGFTLAYTAYSLWGLRRLSRGGWVPPPWTIPLTDLRFVAGEFWFVIKPLIFLPVLLQGNIAAERAVASLLGVDVSAALDYAKIITDTGVLLFAVPLGLAGLSTLSRMNATQVRAQLERILPTLLLTTVPFSVALAMHSRLIVSMLYERGHFGPDSTLLTKEILWGFAIGFWAQVVAYVLIKALSAQLRNEDVFRFMAVALGSNVAINLCLYRLLGPMCLGLGACSCGLVQLLLGARALGVARLIGGRLLWFAAGALGYGMLACAIPTSVETDMAGVGLLFVAYWFGYIAIVPVLRHDVQRLWTRWRLRTA